MRPYTLLAGAALAAVLLDASAAHAQALPPLRFCVESLNLPMSMPHPDRGIEVELARRLAEELGREPVFVWRAPGEDSPDLSVLAGECDVAPGAVAEPGLMMARGAVPGISLTLPYAAAGYLLIRSADAARAPSLAAVGDARIGVETTSIPIYTLKQRGHRVFALDDYDAVIRAVADGRAEYGYLWGPLAAWLLRERSDVRLAEEFEPVDLWNFSLAIREGDEELREALDAAVARLVESGEVARIFTSYGVPYLPPGVAGAEGATIGSG